ncbi:MAG: succinyl-diaminopimelate desuccinylase [Oleiphilaceae bacterium]|jgi:succinyl-diaminopimelate desuccinylase
MTDASKTNTLKLAQALVQQPSVTPEDRDCQAMIMAHLAPLGFTAETMIFGDVTNLWARKGTQSPLITFAGHTDVVPTGPLSDWTHPPFDAVIDGDILHGRGTADMKGSLAAFITACERFIAKHPNHKGSISYLITSDEEGPATNGTVKVIETLEARNEKIDWCLVGEPSSTNVLGDVIKNGRRGSLNARLIVKGKQGHVAYPHLANNPIHNATPALSKLCAQEWDKGNEFFPATSFQITNIQAGTGATNVIPGTQEVLFNFRFSTEVTAEQLKERTHAIMDKFEFDYDIDWNLSGQPFLTAAGPLVDAAKNAIQAVKGIQTELSTSGGTSDGRFIAPTGAQVLELGPLNATIHQIDECVSISDLNNLSIIYEKMLIELLVS